jgi:hypothetical protein
MDDSSGEEHFRKIASKPGPKNGHSNENKQRVEEEKVGQWFVEKHYGSNISHPTRNTGRAERRFATGF